MRWVAKDAGWNATLREEKGVEAEAESGGLRNGAKKNEEKKTETFVKEGDPHHLRTAQGCVHHHG